jgi:hypothetical protein
MHYQEISSEMINIKSFNPLIRKIMVQTNGIMKRILLLLLLFTVFYLQPAVGQVMFEKVIGGGGFDYGCGIIQTNDSGYIVAGEYDYGSGNFNDFYLLKFDYAGNMQWGETIGGFYFEDTDRGFIKANDGSYLICGSTTSNGIGSRDIYLIKVDSIGNVLWSKCYGYPGKVYQGSRLKQIQDGGFIITGIMENGMLILKLNMNGILQWSYAIGNMCTTHQAWGHGIVETTDGDYVICGETACYGQGLRDVYVAKISSNGNLIWTRTIGGPGDDYGYEIIQTQDGGYAIAGHTFSFGAGNNDCYIVKLDSSGNLDWTKTIGGINGDAAQSIVQSNDGSYILCGNTNSFGQGNADVYIIKLDSIGNILFTRTIGGLRGDNAISFIETNDGGYAFCGTTDNMPYAYDLFIVKLDSNFNSNCGISGTGGIAGSGGIIDSGGVLVSPITLQDSIEFSIAAPTDMFDCITRIDKIKSIEDSFNIYPNPATSSFTISLPNQLSTFNLQLSIYDVMGRKVYERSFDPSRTSGSGGASVTEALEVTVNCNLSSGIYFVRAGEYTQKLVVE